MKNITQRVRRCLQIGEAEAMPVYVSGLAPALRHSSANLFIEGRGPRTCRQSYALVGFRIVGLRTKDNTNDLLL